MPAVCAPENGIISISTARVPERSFGLEGGLFVLTVLVAVFVVCFYAAQSVSAFRKLSWAKMEELARRGKNRVSLDELRDRIDELTPMVGAVRRVCEVAIVLCIWMLLLGRSPVWLSLLMTGALSLVVLSAGSFVLPVAFGEHLAERTAPGAVRLWALLGWLARPLKRFADAVDLIVARVCGDAGPGSPEDRLSDEISEVVSDLEMQGTIEEEAAEMIESVIEFQDRDVAEVMTPRTEMVSIDSRAAPSEALALMTDKGHSRIPVTEENRDNIVGVLYLKDMLNMLADGEHGPSGITAVMREPLFVPETKKIGEVLKEFQAKKIHLAVVIDEYGGTAGLVTLEDILEEIVGEIQDEFDVDALPPLRMVAPGKAQATGKARIDKINEALGVELPEEDEYDTINGLVNWQLGRVPAKGECFRIANVNFAVMDADARLVKLLELERAPGAGGE